MPPTFSKDLWGLSKMNRRQTVDILLSLICAAIGLIAFFYQVSHYVFITAAGVVLAFLFCVFAIVDHKHGDLRRGMGPIKYSSVLTSEITETVLLNDEDHPLASWPLYGKVSMVIGRDAGENQVDINLDSSAYASMIDVEHAVLNYSAGGWYVEDLSSQNGILVQKRKDGRKYKLAPGKPCRLEAGDIIYVGLARLLIR